MLARERANRLARDAVEASQRTKLALEVADDAAQRSAWCTAGLLQKPPGLVGEVLGGIGGPGGRSELHRLGFRDQAFRGEQQVVGVPSVKAVRKLEALRGREA